MLPAAVWAQARFYPENLLGIDIAVERWGDNADMQFMGAPHTGLLGVPYDAAGLLFRSGPDTFEVTLLIDRMTDQVRWVRSIRQGGRHLQSVANYSGGDADSSWLRGPAGIAVASAGRFYDAATDRIFVADRMNHRLVKLNFHLDPANPENDHFTWESSTFIDSAFFPGDMEYLILSPNGGQNRITAIDNRNERLAIFSTDGGLLNIYDIHDPADSIRHIHSSIAYKPDSLGAATLYLVDRGHCLVRRFSFTIQSGVQYQNQISLGEAECILSCALYHPILGLWALERTGPHVYRIADDLSEIIREISFEELDSRLLHNPYWAVLTPERLLVFEEIGPSTGVISFSPDRRYGKGEPPGEAPIPLAFALSPNHPNPFNPNTTIDYAIPAGGWVRLEIFNILGQRVRTLVNEYRIPGRYSVVWDSRNDSGDDVSSSIYLAKLSTGDNTATQKMILLK
jgi:hypothetical protein